MRAMPGLIALAACAGEGTWTVETWGEDYVERGIPSEVFVDGCSVVYGEMVIATTSVELIDGDGLVVGDVGGAMPIDLVIPGPTEVGAATVPADHYSEVDFAIASVLVDGTLSCPNGEARFRWTFEEPTTYTCDPPDLTIPIRAEDSTQITIHGDHLFYDGLENPDAAVRGAEILAADADGDGEITLHELEAVSIPALGFDVGQQSDVVTLRQFVSRLTRTIGHVDGEGECRAG